MAVNIESLKAAQARGLTAGVVPAPGAPLPLRLEIDDFIQDTELANLYFLALASYMSEEAAKTPFSYFEISGIHGQPNRSWNRQPPSSEWVANTPNGDARRYTYCAHSSLVFPTWHRAYLAQFEQGLYVHAAALAPALRAEKVLERFRIPYLDPLLPRQIVGRQYTYGIPIILTLPKINVKRTADGPWVPTDNPLYSYKFSNADRAQMNFRSWGNLRNPSQFTMRAYDFQRDQPNHEILMRAFDNLYNPNINLSTQGFDNLYRVMTDERQTWTTMSNSGRSGDLGMNSLEGFHDNLHVQISWGMPFRVDRSPMGHMSNPDFAAFDPSFWLHHCNVDRLTAIWQGLKSEAPESVRWWAANARPRNDRNDSQPASFWARGPETDLVPFVRAQTGGRDVYWKSNDLRDHRSLGHDYPETAAARRQTREPYVQALRRWANTELGWLGRVTTGGDPAAIARLNDSLTRSIPFFPKEILIDGDRNKPLRSTQGFIGSKFVATPAPGPTPRGVSAAPMEAQFSNLAVSPAAVPPAPAGATSDKPSPPAPQPVTPDPAPAQRSAPQQFQAPPTAPAPAPAKGKHTRGLSGLTSKLAAKVASVTGNSSKPEASPAVAAAAPSSSATPTTAASPPPKDRTSGISSFASKLGTKVASVASQKVKEAAAAKPQGKTAEFSALATKVHKTVHDALEDLHGDVHTAVKEAHEKLHERVLDRAIPFVDLSFQTRFGHLKDLLSDEKIIQWNVTYTVDKFCLDGSFLINFFLGDFGSNAGEWVLDGHLAGQSAIFASDRERIDGEGGCDSCREQEQDGMVYGDTVGLSEALLVYYGNQEEVYGKRVANLKPEVVVPFLTRNLHWRIESARAGDVARESIPSLKIGVFSEVLRLPDKVTDLPRYEDRTLHYEITAGRPNGLNPGQTF